MHKSSADTALQGSEPDLSNKFCAGTPRKVEEEKEETNRARVFEVEAACFHSRPAEIRVVECSSSSQSTLR